MFPNFSLIPIWHQSEPFDGNCVFYTAKRGCLLVSLTPRVGDRNGETFLQAEILWLENHLVCGAEYDMERQAKYEDNKL